MPFLKSAGHHLLDLIPSSHID